MSRYILMWRRGRRYSFVKEFAPPEKPGHPWNYLFSIESAACVGWSTWQEAQRVRMDLFNAGMFRYGRGGLRCRLSVVDAADPFKHAQRAINRAYKPRGIVEPTADERVRLEEYVAVCYARAAATGLKLPLLSEVKVLLKDGRGASRGGRGRGQYFIAVHRAALNSTKPGFGQYIVAHELAHVADVFARNTTDHGPHFMSCLRSICPAGLQAYELTYKKAAARAAGIRVEHSAPEIRQAIHEIECRRYGVQMAARFT